MKKKEDSVHPYIPNSVEEVRTEMLAEIGATSVDQLFDEMIPRALRLKGPMNLPKALPSEYDLMKHVRQILSENITSSDSLNFLGAGCWQHHVPAVCDTIAQRSEFLTSYAGETYSDLGRFQCFFEFQSMLGELVGLDIVGVPTYDWGASAANAIRMASRINGRKQVLIPRFVSPQRLSIIRNFCQREAMPDHIQIRLVDCNPENGMINIDDLKRKISTETAAVYFENPSYIGIIEERGAEISDLTHDHGAESIVGVDPISLGVLSPPSEYGADIVCGDIQPLGIHMYCGGGLGGFIACRDEEKYVAEHPSFLISITETEREHEYGFGHCRFDRTSFVGRERGKDWTGTSTALWGIVAAVFMALMGPKGMKEIGEVIIEKSHYAARKLSGVPGITVPFNTFFKEFVVKLNKGTVRDLNGKLRKEKIFGGKDISSEFPELGQSALYCVTEVHSKQDIEKLARSLEAMVG
jgi:glycine cleavage system P protein (glycine dehydrogenase) subunit 1